MKKNNKKQHLQQTEPIWQQRTSMPPSELNILFTAGRDVKSKPAADELLIPYDIWTNRAHCLMLHRQKIISTDVARKILDSLDAISNLYRKNQFHIDPHLEDVHMNIENFIAEDIGPETGAWLHTARSRNDQSTTDIRLFVRDRLLQKTETTIELIEVLLEKAKKYTDAVMPGLTHLRFASLTTWSHYLLSYAQSLERDLYRLQMAYETVNQSPLGAVASYGTTWNIDRTYTAQLLGFKRVQMNTIDCLTSRWEIETEVATAVSYLLNHLSIISQDLLIFTLPPLALLEIDDRFVTGSSVMPQKRNLDFAEVTRAKASLVQGYVQALWGIGHANTSGYNRDAQWTKYIIIDVFDEARSSTILFRDIFKTLKPNKRNMQRAAEQGFLNAVEVADFLSQTYKIPFRISYKVVAAAVRASVSEGALSPEKINLSLKQHNISIKIKKEEWDKIKKLQNVIERKKHIGGSAPEAILENCKVLENVIKQQRKWLEQQTTLLNNSKRFLTQQIKEVMGS